MHEAIMARHGEIAELLLKRGAQVNAKMSDGCTPLLLAIEAGDDDLARRLMGFGADIHLSEQMGHTAFTAALIHHHFALAEELLQRGSNPNQRIEPFHCTPLMSACEGKCLDEVQFLLRSGVEIGLEDDRGKTALHCAVTGAAVRVTAWSSSGKGLHDEDRPEDALKIVDLLLRAGADPLAKDDQGNTPIAMAKKFRLPAILTLLEGRAR